MISKNHCTHSQENQKTNSILPSWFRQAIPNQKTIDVKKLLSAQGLNTVCAEAHCPNQNTCWAQGVATFMILGEHCTRNCHFCAVEQGVLLAPDVDEPRRVAQAAQILGLKYVVITSVTRDDLQDQGVGQFIKTIEELKLLNPEIKVECLTPDFNNQPDLLQQLSHSKVDVLAHNLETVRRVYASVRPEAEYEKALDVLRAYKKMMIQPVIKSGFMVGLGECFDEVIELMADLRAAGCDILTIGQYLSPTSGRQHAAVKRFWSPEEFDQLKKRALDMGFLSVASGPLVRSSFMAEEIFRQAKGC